MVRMIVNIALIIMISFSVYAEKNYLFEHLTLRDGLSQSSIQAIIQDKSGFLWFGTADGLNRFDGYKFKIYLNNPFQEGSISDNSITTFYKDYKGNLWIGTASGFINKYDEEKDHFIKFNITEIESYEGIPVDDRSDLPLILSRFANTTITSICEDNFGNLWISTWKQGILIFNPDSKKGKRLVNIKGVNSIPSDKVTKLVKDINGNIWGATLDNGIFIIPLDPNVNILDDPNFVSNNLMSINKINGLPDNSIVSLLIDSKNNLWIGSFNSGLFLLGLNDFDFIEINMKIKIFSSNKSNIESISSNNVMSIIEDKDGFIWIGTFGGGLNRLNPITFSITYFKHNQFDENTISDNDLISLFEDRSGIIWVGTHLGKGISKLDKAARKFNLIQHEPGNPNSLNNNIVWAIYEDENEVLWIGTYRGGLNKYNRSTRKFSSYQFLENKPNSISYNHIRTIVEDNEGNLWIGTFNGGLNKFNKKTEKFIRYQYNPENFKSISANQIQSLYIDKYNYLWIGTFGGGINKLDLNNYDEENPDYIKFRHLPNNEMTPSDDRIYVIYEDKDEDIWFGTFGGGLNLFNRKDNSFKSYFSSAEIQNSLSDNRITSIYQDSNDNFWIGTYGGGLNLFNKKNNSFERITGIEGLIISVVYGILEDDNKNIWLSADNGIIKLNTLTKKGLLYNLHDGIQSIEFNGGAYFKNKKGELFFGGISGLNYFHPANIRVNEHIPPIVITDFKIFNHSIPGKHNNIRLSYDQNFFSFEFASLDFTNPANNFYAYMLEGFDKEWIYVDSKHRIANYTNLSPGEYLFKVKGSNNDAVWNDEGVEVQVTILPPFWRRWEFIIITSIILLGSLLYFATIRIRNYLIIEKLKSKLAADLHDNIGSGLTEISILSELVAAETGINNLSTTEKLNHISNISRELIDNMSDIVWMVNPKRDSLHDLLLRLKDSYADLFTQLGISFKTHNLEELENIRLPMDCKQNLYLIFKEGINNCLKHSECKKIILEAQVRNNILSMRLVDDGKGFNESSIEFGNGIRNMKKRAVSINGKLKFKSTQASGTVITFVGNIKQQKIRNIISDLIEFKNYITRK